VQHPVLEIFIQEKILGCKIGVVHAASKSIRLVFMDIKRLPAFL
jgi:hypothetical protein